MKITYIHHSSFLVELEQTYLLFDYFYGEIPELKQDKPLFVFVSHRHEDHFSKLIFELAVKHTDIIYFISDDIWESKIPDELYGKVQFMGPNEQENFRYNDKTISVYTFKSTDEGVAYLIDVEDSRIYHAGDLNYWYWEGEAKAWNNNQKVDYRRELQKISEIVKRDNKVPDIAFIPADSRLGDYFYLGVEDYMNIVGASHVFPMHMSGDFSVGDRLKNHEAIKKYSDNIVKINEQNESFEV